MKYKLYGDIVCDVSSVRNRNVYPNKVRRYGDDEVDHHRVYALLNS